MFDWKLFILFCVLNVVNVILQTVKSLVTVKCGKVAAALMNALAYGLYTVVVVYMVCELPLWLKATVIATANLIGVYIVKDIEQRKRKDKLWKVEVTVPNSNSGAVEGCLGGISHSVVDMGKDTLFNFYCSSQEESRKVRQVVNQFNAKYFVSESKAL